MLSIAFKMLIGNRAVFLGLIFGIFLSSFLVCQQTAIFLGLITRSYRLITDIPTANIWVMDKGTEHIDKVREMRDTELDIVRSVPGVELATPLGYTYIPIKLNNGLFHIAQIVAIDEKTLFGAPQHMIEGDAQELRIDGGVILDEHAVNKELAFKNSQGQKETLKVGDKFEIANHRAVLVGVAKLTLGFYPQPVLYLGYKQYETITPFKTNHLSFILVRAKPGQDLDELVQRIKQETGLEAYTSKGFKWRSIRYFLGTGILVNFGITVLLGFILGVAIVGIMFYMLILENLPYFAMIRALGAKSKKIIAMVLFQALIVGAIGFGLGVGAASLVGYFIILSAGSIAFLFPPAVLLIAAFSVFLICIVTAFLGIKKILNEDPKVVMVG